MEIINNTTIFGKGQLKRLKIDWDRITGEDVRMKLICSTIYGYCSKEASKKLLAYYGGGARYNTCIDHKGNTYFELELQYF